MSSLETRNPDSRAAEFVERLKMCALFAEALSLCLASAGVRPIELSRRLYVEPATVHNWRKDKRLPDAVMVLRVANALGLDSDQQQMLVDAWRVTRRARELVPCVEEARQCRDVVTVLALKEEFSKQLASVQRRIQSVKWDRLYAMSDGAAQSSDLDPEIWLYSGY